MNKIQASNTINRRVSEEVIAMYIERLFVGGRLDNYNYMAICRETGSVLVVDPLGVDELLNYVTEHQLKITHIANTHEHGDHIAGNQRLKEATGARLLMPITMQDLAAAKHADAWVQGGDCIRVGASELSVIATPGHTMRHIGFYDEESKGLICGDTVFHAGVGNCYNGGDVATLYHTIHHVILSLPETTHIYPSHDNLANNLRFSLSREPSNQVAAALLAQAETETPETRSGTTLAMEKAINPFFRLHSAELKATLKKDIADVDVDDPVSIFAGLRQLRDRW